MELSTQVKFLFILQVIRIIVRCKEQIADVMINTDLEGEEIYYERRDRSIFNL